MTFLSRVRQQSQEAHMHIHREKGRGREREEGVLITSPFLPLIQSKTPAHELVLTHAEWIFLPPLS